MDSSETRHWFKLPVPLAWLCELDNRPAANALPDAFGDRYLYHCNPIYANIRDAAIGFGYRFSSEDTPLWRDYVVFGLTTLHRILADRVIPYMSTARTVRRLLEHDPKAAIAPGFLLSSLRANHVFHESAHAVAHTVLARAGQQLQILAPDEKDRFVLASVLAESFANTVERLGSACERLQVSDNLFYALNSYIAPRAKQTGIFAAGQKELGFEGLFVLLFAASFEANLDTATPSEAVYERIERTADPPAPADAARSVINVGFDLSRKFREDTTPMYFDLMGCGKEYRNLAAAHWLSRPEHQEFTRVLARRLAEISRAPRNPV